MSTLSSVLLAVLLLQAIASVVSKRLRADNLDPALRQKAIKFDADLTLVLATALALSLVFTTP